MKPSTAKVYALLKVRGVDGVSPDEARRWAGCDRLAARVSELRAEGHEVMTLRNAARLHLRQVRPATAGTVPYPAAQPEWASDNMEGVSEGEMRLLWGDR